MIAARGDRGDSFAGQNTRLIHQHRRRAGDVRAIAQLPESIESPSDERAIRAQRQAVLGILRNRAAGHCDDPLADQHPGAIHQHRLHALNGAAVSELALIVSSPSGHRAILTHRDAGLSAGRQPDDCFAGQYAGNIHRHRLRAGRVGIITQLPVCVVSPSGQRAIRGQRQVVIAARSHPHNRLASQYAKPHRRGHRSVGGRSVTEVAVGVVPPRQQPALGPLQYQIVASAAVVVDDEWIIDAAIGQGDRLPLRQIGKTPLDWQPAGVFHQHERCARQRGEA